MHQNLTGLAGLLAVAPSTALNARHAGWRHQGSIHITTTPEGAHLPAAADTMVLK